MKKLLFILAALLLAGCIQQQYTFKQGFEEVLALDEKYNASFYDEAIDPGNRYNSSLFLPVQGRILVPLENIDPFIEDLDMIKDRISKEDPTSHTAALTEFIEFRKKMLDMQRYYQKGDIKKESLVKGSLIAGPKRSAVISLRGFKCSEGLDIYEAAEYYNKSANLGKEAVDMMDDMLNKYQQDPDVPAVVGLDNSDPALTKRPKFIDGPFWPMIKVMNSNANRIKQLCGTKEELLDEENSQ